MRFVWLTALVGAVALSLSPLRESPRPVLEEVTYSSFRSADPMLTEAGSRRVTQFAASAGVLMREAVARPLRAARGVSTRELDRLLSVGWLAASFSLFVVGLFTYRRYRHERRRWTRTQLRGTTVRVAPSSGPAVIGLLKAEIVVPAWLLSASDEEQRMVLLHEREHVAARDPLLLAIAASATVLVPWNPIAWWMLYRARAAVEMDCDSRVLAQGVETGNYGNLLIDMAGRGAGLPLSVAALAASSSTLERRLTAMAKATGSYTMARTAALGLLGSVALITACEARMPTAVEVADMDVAAVERQAEMFIVRGSESQPVFEVDGVVVTADEARRLEASRIRQVEVIKQGADGQGRIKITTIAAAGDEDDDAPKGAMLRQFSVATDGEAGATQIRVKATGSGGGDVQVLRVSPLAGDAAILFIDGVRVDPTRMRTLKPEDIARVEVIKGEAAVQRFGDPAARNGVVRITTKAAADRQP
ncbi:hypothetical protein BH23GEM6_BH23GEM6_10540 [soil metagenome]